MRDQDIAPYIGGPGRKNRDSWAGGGWGLWNLEYKGPMMAPEPLKGLTAVTEQYVKVQGR